MNKLRLYIVSLGVLLSGALAVNGLTTSVSAVVDNDPDCDNVAIIRCGAFTMDKMREKASKGDVPVVFNAMGISQNELDGKFVSGIVWRNGTVTVDGKVVATGAMTAGRNFGGTPIPNTNNVGKYPTSKFVTEGQTAFVKMTNGKFDFALIKACGNPVSAVPKVVPPAPKDIKVCVLATKKIITIKENKFDSTKHTKDLTRCREEKIKVCELATKKIITINKSAFDSSKHSKNLNDCKVTPPVLGSIQVCELSTKTLITIKETEFDSAKHSKNFNDCEEEAPQVIAVTGPETMVAGLFGSSALGYGAYSYAQSRRQLINKLLGR